MTTLPPEPVAPATPDADNQPGSADDQTPPTLNLTGLTGFTGLVIDEPEGTINDSQLFGADEGVLS
jgi:hypothetical protein